ncbi:hypothetical protein KKG45_00895, partial [bacterium]|nr:hypothetical protein [bacterium]
MLHTVAVLGRRPALFKTVADWRLPDVRFTLHDSPSEALAVFAEGTGSLLIFDTTGYHRSRHVVEKFLSLRGDADLIVLGEPAVLSGLQDKSHRGALRRLASTVPADELRLEVERLLSSAGPTGGELLRRSNGQVPEQVAFVQCVGSRDPDENPWCSRICCLNTIKQACQVKARYPEVKVSVYHGDIRLYKKEHEDFYRLARDQGIVFMRSHVEEVAPRGDRLEVRAIDELLDGPTAQEVGMVVLACGLTRTDDAQKLQDMLKVPSSADGFLLEAHPKLRPLETAIDGVMLAGTCQFPKDIGDCMLQASGAAAKCMG